jgi:hypothetical protein
MLYCIQSLLLKSVSLISRFTISNLDILMQLLLGVIWHAREYFRFDYSAFNKFIVCRNTPAFYSFERTYKRDVRYSLRLRIMLLTLNEGSLEASFTRNILIETLSVAILFLYSIFRIFKLTNIN